MSLGYIRVRVPRRTLRCCLPYGPTQSALVPAPESRRNKDERKPECHPRVGICVVTCSDMYSNLVICAVIRGRDTRQEDVEHHLLRVVYHQVYKVPRNESGNVCSNMVICVVIWYFVWLSGNLCSSLTGTKMRRYQSC